MVVKKKIAKKETKECSVCGYAKADKGRVEFKDRYAWSMMVGTSAVFVTFVWFIITFSIADSIPEKSAATLVLAGLLGVALAIVFSFVTFGILIQGRFIKYKWAPRG